MRVYVVEVCDRWSHWHSVIECGTTITVFIEKVDALRQAANWTALEKKNGYKEFGIKYRVMPFSEKRVRIQKRKKPLK